MVVSPALLLRQVGRARSTIPESEPRPEFLLPRPLYRTGFTTSRDLIEHTSYSKLSTRLSNTSKKPLLRAPSQQERDGWLARETAPSEAFGIIE